MPYFNFTNFIDCVFNIHFMPTQIRQNKKYLKTKIRTMLQLELGKTQRRVHHFERQKTLRQTHRSACTLAYN